MSVNIKYAIFSLENDEDFDKVLGRTDENNFNTWQEAMNWLVGNPSELREGSEYTILPVVSVVNKKKSINLE